MVTYIESRIVIQYTVIVTGVIMFSSTSIGSVGSIMGNAQVYRGRYISEAKHPPFHQYHIHTIYMCTDRQA